MKPLSAAGASNQSGGCCSLGDGFLDLALHHFDLAPGAVRQRFAWARRQGQPGWLWPEIAIERWQLALTHIEQVLRSVLAGAPNPVPLDGDAAALGIAGYTSGTGPLLGWWIEQGVIRATPAVSDVLKPHLEHNRLRMKLLTQEGVAIARLLAGAGVETFIIKGMHTAHVYFPEPETRPAADIDLLIQPSAEEILGDVLSSSGYLPGPWIACPRQRSWKRPDVASDPHSLAFVHAHDPWSVDLQSALDRRYSAGAPIVRLDDERSASAVGPWPLMSGAKVLGQPLLLLHLAVHSCCGFSSLSLLRLLEMIFVIRRDTAGGALVWRDFVAMAKRAGGLGLIYPALKLCEDLAPGTIPDAVIAAARAHVPPSVRRVVDPLAPAHAQRIIRCSLSERFMWTGSPSGLARQLAVELFPEASSLRDLTAIYATRAWRLARGTLTR